MAFDLSDTTPKVYLHHRSEVGEFFLSSDAVIPSFRKDRRMAPIIAQVPGRQWNRFMSTTYTMGGMMLFPSNKIDGRMTINGARGCHPRIKDRFDLTVECIRRHYIDQESPLSSVLKRYSSFFALFESFRGYVDFFLLQDLVSPDYVSVKRFTAFGGFDMSPLPSSYGAYAGYRKLALNFVNERNRRIAKDIESRRGSAA